LIELVAQVNRVDVVYTKVSGVSDSKQTTVPHSRSENMMIWV
jgi:hypothetical protein